MFNSRRILKKFGQGQPPQEDFTVQQERTTSGQTSPHRRVREVDKAKSLAPPLRDPQPSDQTGTEKAIRQQQAPVRHGEETNDSPGREAKRPLRTTGRSVALREIDKVLLGRTGQEVSAPTKPPAYGEPSQSAAPKITSQLATDMGEKGEPGGRLAILPEDIRAALKSQSIAILALDDGLKQELKDRLLEAGLTGPVMEGTLYYPGAQKLLMGEIERFKPNIAVVDFSDIDAGIITSQKLQELQEPPAIIAVCNSTDTDLILRAMRAGVVEFLRLPVTEENLISSMVRVLKMRESETRPKKPTGRAFTFFSSKGGNGATVISTNLAMNLAQLTKGSVIIVDLAVQLGEVALYMGLRPQYDIVDAVENLHRLDKTLLEGMVAKHESGAHVLASSDRPDRAARVTPAQIGQLLSFLKQNYDYLVIDTSNAFDQFAITAFDYSDEIFIVNEPDVPSIRNTMRCLYLLDVLGYDEKVKVLLNRFERRQGMTIEDIERAINRPVYWAFPNNYPAVISATNQGKPIDADEGDELWSSLDQFAQQLSGVKRPERKKGILSIFGPS